MPTLLLWLTFLPTLLILYLMLNWLPTLVVAKGLDRAVAPQASLAFNWASVAGALLIGWLVDRFGPRWPLTLAYAGLIASLVALGAASDHTMIVAYSGIAGFLLLGANYALYGVAPSYYPSAMRGTGSGASVGGRARGFDPRAARGRPHVVGRAERRGRGAVHGARGGRRRHRRVRAEFLQNGAGTDS